MRLPVQSADRTERRLARAGRIEELVTTRAAQQASVAAGRGRGGNPPIKLERTNVTGITHVDGTLSMARSAPDSATSSFFIVIGSQPALDFGGHRNLDGQGFAAFGHVVSGMDVVKKIQMSPRNQAGRTTQELQSLTPPIRIDSIVRVSR